MALRTAFLIGNSFDIGILLPGLKLSDELRLNLGFFKALNVEDGRSADGERDSY